MTFARRPHPGHRLVPEGFVQRTASGPTALLTFDDGPHPIYTLAVLDRLREWKRRAIFFVIGDRLARAPGVLRRIVDDGHQIGNHTMHHPRLGYHAVRAAWQEVCECQRLVRAAIRETPAVFRPPYGRVTPGLWAAARGQGMDVLNWSLDSGDWRVRTAAEAERCGAELADAMRPGDVVLLHDHHEYIGRVLDRLMNVNAFV